MTKKVELNVAGMHCGSCAVGIQMLVSNLNGVKSAEVNYEGKKGVFEFDPTKLKKEDIIKAIAELGYDATG